MSSIIVAHGLAPSALPGDEQADAPVIIRRIANLCFSFILELLQPSTQCTTATATETTVVLPTCNIPREQLFSLRLLTKRTCPSFARTWEVLAKVHELLRLRRRVSQRELYYMLVHTFHSQIELNLTVSKVSTILGVPRYALNIDAASRGVLAGCVTLGLTGSNFRIDCRHVGSVRSFLNTLFVCIPIYCFVLQCV